MPPAAISRALRAALLLLAPRRGAAARIGSMGELQVALEGDLAELSSVGELFAALGGQDRADLEDRGGASSRLQCPALGGPTGKDHSGLSLQDASRLIGEQNCAQRAHAYMCSFPPKGLSVGASQDVTERAVVNVDVQLFGERIHGEGAWLFSALVPQEEDVLWVVEYYADWCPHCKAFAPTWLALAAALAADNKKTRFASVNCEVHELLCSTRSVRGYPMVEWFYSGSALSRDDILRAWGSMDDASDEEIIVKLEEQRGLSREAAKALINQARQHGQLPPRKSDPGWPKGGPYSGEVAHGATSLKGFLKGLPAAYGLDDGTMDAALAMAENAATLDHCPPSRPMADGGLFKNSGWPAGELAATPETRVAEAGFMLAYTLKNWITPAASRGKSLAAFDYHDMRHVRSWVGLLAGNFPAARGPLGDLAAFVGNASSAGAVCVSDWHREVQKLQTLFGADAPVGPQYCSTDTCRVWTLLHILSISPATGLEGALSAESTNAAIADFIATFFRCEHCRKHAVEQYGAGAYGRDELIARGGDGLALYWWRFHNAVSVRIAAEGGCLADRRWPPPDLCPECWAQSDEAWDVLEEARAIFADRPGGALEAGAGALPDEGAVLAFLKAAFSPAAA